MNWIEDKRGKLLELKDFPKVGGRMYIIKINPGETRGNHYHKIQVETFLVLEGEADLCVDNQLIRLTGDVVQVISVTPPQHHWIRATEKGCIVLIHSTREHNKADPDTYNKEVI